MESSFEFISLHCDLQNIFYSENIIGKQKAQDVIFVYKNWQTYFKYILQE